MLVSISLTYFFHLNLQSLVFMMLVGSYEIMQLRCTPQKNKDPRSFIVINCRHFIRVKVCTLALPYIHSKSCQWTNAHYLKSFELFLCYYLLTKMSCKFHIAFYYSPWPFLPLARVQRHMSCLVYSRMTILVTMRVSNHFLISVKSILVCLPLVYYMNLYS